jgi:hypothetical protein
MGPTSGGWGTASLRPSHPFLGLLTRVPPNDARHRRAVGLTADALVRAFFILSVIWMKKKSGLWK